MRTEQITAFLTRHGFIELSAGRDTSEFMDKVFGQKSSERH